MTQFLMGGFVANAQLRIIGGSAVDISQRPYQAAIFINGTEAASSYRLIISLRQPMWYVLRDRLLRCLHHPSR